MNIVYKFIAYGGSFFYDEQGEKVDYKDIKDNFYKLEGRRGKLIYQGYTNVQEHGYSGGYENYGFVFQDDLSSISLDKSEHYLKYDDIFEEPTLSKEFLEKFSYKEWETVNQETKEKLLEFIKDNDPVYEGNSLHVWEQRFEMDGILYRFIGAISDPEDLTIEKLIV